MRKCLFPLIIFLIVSFTIQAQTRIKISKVPAEVIKTFDSKFTDFRKVIWRKMGTLYEAEVFKGKKVSFATFEATGNYIETLTEIKVAEIPEEVIAGVKKLYSSAEIKAAAIIEQAAGEALYIVQFRFHGKKGEVTLDKNGVQK